MRTLALLVLAAPWATAAVHGAQHEAAVSARRDHDEVLRAERTARLRRAWEEASPERRASCEAAVRALVPDSRPAGMRPRLEELALLTRVLDGEPLDAAREDLLARFADALDLRVVPGAFEARGSDADRGEPLSVHVVRSFPVPIGGEVRVTLVWLAPDGTERDARSEPFSVAAFKPPGGTMYVRAPHSPPATWRLVAEVARGARRVRGVPVEVPCVPAGTPLEEGLRERGLRDVALDPAHGVRPWADAPFADAAEPWVLEGGDAGATVLVLAPSEESPRTLFAGEAGARWTAFARHGGHRIVTLRPGLSRGGLARGVEELRRREPERAVHLVARGDAVRTLAREAARAAPRLDGLVLLADRVALPRALDGVPALLVAHVLPDELAAREDVRWVPLSAPLALLAEAQLPALLEDWWDGGADR